MPFDCADAQLSPQHADPGHSRIHRHVRPKNYRIGRIEREKQERPQRRRGHPEAASAFTLEANTSAVIQLQPVAIARMGEMRVVSALSISTSAFTKAMPRELQRRRQLTPAQH